MAQTPPDRIPVSTYRVQLHASFTFHDAAKLVPYFSGLGVTELYCSPILTAAPGSGHGYDICDYGSLNAELGGEAGLAELSAQLKKHNMGLLLDFVPNHMGVNESANQWWRDVLENGPSSPFAHYFDIDWHPVKRELEDKLLLPILGDQYGTVLDRGELQIDFRDGAFALRYFDHSLPLNPRQLQILLQHQLGELKSKLAEDDPDLNEFLSILFHLEHLPPYQETASIAIHERQREKEVAKRRLAVLANNSSAIRTHIERNVLEFNGVAGDPASFQLLHQLLEAQPYRLSFWRTATHEINYRRFFDINELAGIRMEDPEVFAASHGLVLRLIADGVVTGLRLDHVDGLFDPRAYFEQLHQAVGPERHIYLAVEKILSESEDIRNDWAIHGTTGYEFLNHLNGIFVDTSGAHDFQKLYRRITGAPRSFSEVVYRSKRLIVETAMASELNVLAHEANRISESDPHSRDFTLMSLQEALTEVVACFPVYRSYVSAADWDKFDERTVDVAIRDALLRNPAMEASIFQFIRSLLLPSPKDAHSTDDWERRLRFAMKVQQYTGPVQAKGVEDTAFYRYGPLMSLNEVGGHPNRFGVTPGQFHAANCKRLARVPFSISCTETHDTKRGEDARARLNVLSEIPAEWDRQVRTWTRINSSARQRVNGEMAPDRSDEYLFYQALIGAWPTDFSEQASPDFVERARAYMNKATKEKKIHTSWIKPSAEFDSAMARFVDQTLAGTRAQPFLAQFLPFQRRVAELGMVNSLAQLVLKVASPGVPDIYQGSELWDLSFVDPDNRRAVDYADRRNALAGLRPLLEGEASKAMAAKLLAQWPNGYVKLFVTAAALRLREAYPSVFLSGDYQPVETAGRAAVHLLAFSRTLGDQVVVAAAPRLVTSLCGFERGLPLGEAIWGNTVLQLPPALRAVTFREQFTGAQVTPEPDGTIRAAKLLDSFPTALLFGQTQESRGAA